MTATITPIRTRRELAHRSVDGLEVTLYWNPRNDRVTVAVEDTKFAESFEFDVPGDCALDAFNHPFAYAEQLVA